MTGVQTCALPISPLYPFGHGLSYTQFHYGRLHLDAARIRSDGTLTLRVEITNTGSTAGDEVVQAYVRRRGAGPDDAQQSLRGFQRISLAPAEKRTVTFTLDAAQALRQYDDARGTYVVAPGAYEVRVGSSSADIRAEAGFTVETRRD